MRAISVRGLEIRANINENYCLAATPGTEQSPKRIALLAPAVTPVRATRVSVLSDPRGRRFDVFPECSVRAIRRQLTESNQPIFGGPVCARSPTRTAVYDADNYAEISRTAKYAATGFTL